MKRIVHLCADEKFIDAAIRQFESVRPQQNACFVITARRRLRHVRTPNAQRVHPLLASLGWVQASLRTADLIVLHSLSLPLWKACRGLPPHIPVVWLGFGFDYYDLIVDNTAELSGPLTASYARAAQAGIRGWFRARKQRRWMAVKQIAITRITHFAPVLPTEYTLIRARHPDFAPTLVPWSYSSIEDTLHGQQSQLADEADDILVGNNSSTTNNHLETLQLLDDLPLARHRRIVMPLSYGNRRYRAVVLTAGQRLGERFVPLIDFIPAAEYVTILSRCRTAIMNHVRQQAVGNIRLLLQQGSVVFFNERSPLYTFLKDGGAHIFSIAALTNEPTLIELRLTNEQIEQNREVLAQYWGRPAVSRKIQALLSTTLPD